MVFDYAGLIGPISNIIDDFEQGTISIVRKSATQDAGDPWKYTTTESETNINAVIAGVNSKRINNTSILTGDFHVILSYKAVTQAPADSDLIRIDGKDYQIIEVKNIPPAGTIICYRIRCRSI